MNAGVPGGLVGESQVNVAALADIVHDLVAGGLSRLQDDGWLDERATAAGLDAHERGALERLRLRLLDGSAVLLRASIGLWG